MSTVESPQPGLRERKKEQTRQLIAETARRLFSERGFERVTVAEVARAAEVSEQTVFNYFPTKEDLVYWRLQSFEDELLRTIREREPGEPALAAFGRFILAERGLLGQARPPGPRGARGAHADDHQSPALLAREQQIFASYTASLAALLARGDGRRRRRRQAVGRRQRDDGRAQRDRAPRAAPGHRGRAAPEAGGRGPRARRGGARAARRRASSDYAVKG